MSEHTADKIETVLAHELFHHVNRDYPLSITYETVSTTLLLFLLVLMLYRLVTMPLSKGFSRWRSESR